jgi:hypothetical protein
MKTSNVSTVVISKIKRDLDKQLSEIGRDKFHGASIQHIEEKFFKTLGKAGSVGLSELFSQNDDNPKMILHNGQKHYFKFKSTGKYLTLLGEISVERGIYQSNFSNKSFCPLETKLRFINDYISFGSAEHIAYSTALMTPEEFVKHCNKWALMKPSSSTVKRVTNYVGNFLKTSAFFDIIHAEETAIKEAVTLAISIDATSILIKKEGWKHATAATVSTYDVDGNRLNTVYIGRMPEKGKKKIKELLEKEVEAKLSQQNFKQIVCIADGARENWLYFRKKYPQAIHITDFFHVAEHLSKLSELLFKEPLESKAWFEKYKTILKNEPNGASKVIRAARYRRSLVSKDPEIEKEIKYLQQNRNRMNYFEYQQNNLSIGSGVVEAACKNLIGARLKKAGMSWSNEGGQNVLNLRALILSNRWEIFCNYFLRSHFPEYGT